MHRTVSNLLMFASGLALSWLLPAVPAAAQVGALDPTFDGDGIRVEDHDAVDRGSRLALQSDGKILAFGWSETNGPNSRVARLTRYHPDGSLDASWTYTAADCGPTLREFRAGTVDPHGPILTVGYRQRGCGFRDSDFEVMRIDPTTGGITEVGEYPTFQGHADVSSSMIRQPDGKIVAVGISYGDAASTPSTLDGAIARYDVDLDLDTSFGPNNDGEVLVDFAGDLDILSDVALQGDGKIVAVGFTFDAGQHDFMLVRLNADGSLDTTFGGDGVVTTDFGHDDSASGLAIQSDGKILVAGSRNDASDVAGFTLARYNADGSMDTSFGTAGAVVVDFSGFPANARRLAIQGDGKILVAGRAETGAGGPESRDFVIARLNPSGALDPSFAGDGRQTVDVDFGKEDDAFGLVLRPFDGDVIVVGFAAEVINEVRFEDMAVVQLVGDSCSLDPVVDLDPQDVGTTTTFEACDELHAGSGGFRVLGSGDVTFRAGGLVGLEDGFEVRSGGSFRAAIE